MRKLICLLFLLLPSPLTAIDISASGDWANTLNRDDLKRGIGSDLVSPQVSANNQTILKITNCSGATDAWQVYVHQSPSGWNPELLLQIKRRSDGIGSGTISGGTDWQDVTGSTQLLFSGSGDRSKIKIKYRVQNTSLSISPGSHNTQVYFTIVDI